MNPSGPRHRQKSQPDHSGGDLLARARHLGASAPLFAAAFAHFSIYQGRVSAW